MLKNSIKMQLSVLWERKTATIIFALLMVLVLVNFFSNVLTYQGRDVLDMYHPMKLLTFSTWSEFSYYLRQYYPLLVVIPAGFSLFADHQLNQFIFIQTRIGSKAYYWGKIVTVFLVTFCVFTLPFLIEIGLNMLAFPTHAVGDPSNLGILDQVYLNTISTLFFPIIKQSVYAYAFIFTLFVGVISGILSIFTVSVSAFRIKFKVLLFLPVYLLLHFTAYLKQLVPTINFDTNYFFYLVMHEPVRNVKANSIAIAIFMLITVCTSLLIFLMKMNKDAL
ncbi:hypothetical protein SAMN04488134_101373 [Amphibacillus marinus]|uniref:ABC-2 family transporter protein n=2 Tax=Amphibacillus marinus TaxID=872970 RepID=A0A1H8HL45_9BACI|nr:hypothetical protein SAMN04488134_101373 [Amphibacillus marinus]